MPPCDKNKHLICWLLIENETNCTFCTFPLYFRDLIKVLKWYVDRITEAERQEHIQEVLKVMTRCG